MLPIQPLNAAPRWICCCDCCCLFSADHSTTVGHSTTVDHFPIPFAFALLCFLSFWAIWSKAFVSVAGCFLFSGGGFHFRITSPHASISACCRRVAPRL